MIDALLFIFGKRAKWMRLNKLNELIHNSGKYQNLPRASVQVTFQEILDKVTLFSCNHELNLVFRIMMRTMKWFLIVSFLLREL